MPLPLRRDCWRLSQRDGRLGSILTATWLVLMMPVMRTTVTLDRDVEQLLRDAMQRRRQSFKEALNQAIRNGLSQSSPAGAEDAPFVVHARRMGLRAGIDSARLNQMSDELEVERFNELSQRLTKQHGKSPSRKRT